MNDLATTKHESLEAHAKVVNLDYYFKCCKTYLLKSFALCVESLPVLEDEQKTAFEFSLSSVVESYFSYSAPITKYLKADIPPISPRYTSIHI